MYTPVQGKLEGAPIKRSKRKTVRTGSLYDMGCRCSRYCRSGRHYESNLIFFFHWMLKIDGNAKTRQLLYLATKRSIYLSINAIDGKRLNCGWWLVVDGRGMNIQ